MSDSETTKATPKWVLYLYAVVIVVGAVIGWNLVGNSSASESQQFVGTWYYSDNVSQVYQLDVYSDKRFKFQAHTQTPILGISTGDTSYSGTWSASGNVITLTRSDVAEQYQFSLSSDQSTLKENSQSERIVLYRQEASDSSTGLSNG